MYFPPQYTLVFLIFLILWISFLEKLCIIFQINFSEINTSLLKSGSTQNQIFDFYQINYYDIITSINMFSLFIAIKYSLMTHEPFCEMKNTTTIVTAVLRVVEPKEPRVCRSPV